MRAKTNHKHFFSIHIISLSVCSIYQIILFPLFFLHQMNTIQMSFHQTSSKHTHVKRSFTSPDLYLCHNKEISMHRKIVNLTLSIVRLCSTVKFGSNFWPTYPEFELRTEGIFLNNFFSKTYALLFFCHFQIIYMFNYDTFTKVTRLSLFAEHL